MKTFFVIILSLIFSTQALARAGLAESFFTTPGGYTICWCDPYTDDQLPVLSTNKGIRHNEPLYNVAKFYFYKNHVIGTGKNYFFVFDELTETVQTFKNKLDWKKYISTHTLNPLVTQWLDISDTPFFFNPSYSLIVFLLIITSLLLLYPLITLVLRKKLSCLNYASLIFGVLISVFVYMINIYSF
jgi:hypothetical protein